MAEYKRPVWVEIDLEAIGKNVEVFRNIVGPSIQVMAVVKADAYGHGAQQVAKRALDSGADRLGVALLEEGVSLRESGIGAPIHILGEIPPSGASLAVNHNLIPTVCSLKLAEALSEQAAREEKNVKVHIKVDTGMNRLGLFPHQVPPFLERVANLSHVEVEGLFTHFALADTPQSGFTKRQLNGFTALLAALKEKGYRLRAHAANSAAAVFFPECHLDMIRIGISLYGLHPSPETKEKVKLFPAFRLKATVSSVKRLEAGAGVSYGLTYRAAKPTNIALLPLGYGDGYTRLLSNKADVLIGGRRFPVAGTICMDQLMVDVGDARVSPGDEAVLIGVQGDEEISVDDIADSLGTINYEVVCMINKRVPRVYGAYQPKADE